MRISISTEELGTIASSFRASSDRIEQEAQVVAQQISQLQDAIQGAPVALEDQLTELKGLFAKISTSIQQNQQFITQVTQQVDQIIATLGG